MDRSGYRDVIKILNDMGRLRKAIRAEGTPRIQEAWDRIEPVIDMFYQRPDMGDDSASK